MSLLLDALNKADQERKRNEANPSIHSNHGQAGDHNTRTVSIVVIAGVVIGIVILLVAIYWLGQRSTVTATQVTTTTSAMPQTSTPKTASASQPAINIQPIAPAPTPENPLEEQTSDEDVASLYELNTQIPEPEAQAPAAEPIAITPNNSNGNAEPALSTPTSINQFANLPDLHDLPNQVLVKIPSLNYSEHNYNNIGGSVKINGEIKHANDQLAPGVVIDKILEDGMILHLENYSFKMRALNSWVNM